MIHTSFSDTECLTIIGMPGSGKTTIGRAVAECLGWAHVDTDHLIEATYGVRLQDITDAMDKESFLDVEARVISAIRMQRAVLSTGGSVVYRDYAMEYLTSLGPIVHLDAPLPLLLERIALNPERGIAIAPGQTIEDLFNERDALYRRWRTHSITVVDRTIPDCTAAVIESLGIERKENIYKKR